MTSTGTTVVLSPGRVLNSVHCGALAGLVNPLAGNEKTIIAKMFVGLFGKVIGALVGCTLATAFNPSVCIVALVSNGCPFDRLTIANIENNVYISLDFISCRFYE